MRPETLTVRGVLAFNDERTLDYRSLPPGLIAFTGKNGAGKTALMETPIASLFQQFPSREKKVYDYATRTDAFIEFTFELEGRGLYRTRLSLDGPHRKAEAVLSEIQADGRVIHLTDGKLGTFESAVKGLLPRYEDLMASVFAAQTRKGSFSELEKKERRILFASLLGLDRYQELSERAAQAAARLAREIDLLIAHREGIARSATPAIESDLEQRAQQLQVEAGSVDVRRAALALSIQSAEAELLALGDAMALHAKAVADVSRLEAEQLAQKAQRTAVGTALDRQDADYTSERARMAAAMDAVLSRLANDEVDLTLYETELRQIDARRKAVIDDATKRIAANDALKKDADIIRAAVARVEQIDVALATIEQERGAMADILAALRKRERVLLDALGVIRERENALAYAEQNAASIASAPFGEQCAPCAFMATAAAAKADIPGLREAVASKAAAEEDLGAVQFKIASGETFLADCAADTLKLRTERAERQLKAAELPHLAAAEEKIAGHQKRIADADVDAARERAEAEHRRDQRILRIRIETANRHTEYNGAITVLQEATEQRRKELQASLTDIAAELDRIEHWLGKARHQVTLYAASAGAASEQQALLTAHRREWDETTATKARVEAQVAELARQRGTYLAAKAEAESLHDRVMALQADVVEWNLLAKSLGRDGLQTLEIDAAGPIVSAYANDLSEHCAGGRFTFELVTQAPKVTRGKDGSTHREVFDINLYDQQRGGEKRDIGDLSGGERVIAEEILRSAISLMVNAKSPFPMRAAWRDESTGALDAENAGRYVAMLRRFQEIGGFTYVFLVTHSEDVKVMVDAQVQVADGDFSVALPPFVREAVAA